MPARAVPAAAAAPATPALSAQAEIRRDYELALQVGNKSALNAFLAQYPDGFYASLAKLQLEKIAAEETRVAATEKARLAEQERARLAAEGAQKTQQAKAEADAKAAEQARVCGREGQADCAGAGRRRPSRSAPPPKAPLPTTDCRRQGQGGERGRPQRRTAASRRHQIGADRTAPRRLPDRRRRWQLERGLAAFADAVQPLCRNQARHQARQRRRARCDQAEGVAGLSAGLRARLQGRRRALHARLSAPQGSFLNDDNECEKRRDKKPVAKPRTSRNRGGLPAARAKLGNRGRLCDRPVRRHGQWPGDVDRAVVALTGLERQQGLQWLRQAIMSGVCP